MTTIEEVLAKLPPPWNTDVVAHSFDAQMNNDLVEYFDHKPLPPSRWVPAEEDEDSDGKGFV